jgi:hypothetical protein
VPGGIQSKGTLHRDIRGNLSEQFIADLSIGFATGGQNERLPAIVGKITRKLERALYTTAPTQRGIVKGDH